MANVTPLIARTYHAGDGITTTITITINITTGLFRPDFTGITS